MSRLVDADKVQMKLFEECQNIRHFDKDREKKQIFADGIDFAWVMLDNTPTVKAIPIEWIKDYIMPFQVYHDSLSEERKENDGAGWVVDVLEGMLKRWERENE